MSLNKKKATAEITTALLCRSNIKKDTFKTIAEYLEDDEIRHILDVCIGTLNARGISQPEIAAEMIGKADSFDSIAKHIDSGKLQSILNSCGSALVRRKRKNPVRAMQNMFATPIIEKECRHEKINEIKIKHKPFKPEKGKTYTNHSGLQYECLEVSEDTAVFKSLGGWICTAHHLVW